MNGRVIDLQRRREAIREDERDFARTMRELNAINENVRSSERLALMKTARRLLANDPEIVAERAGWLFAGQFGRGAQLAALAIVDGRSPDRLFDLVRMTLALDDRVPFDITEYVWDDMPLAQQRRVRSLAEREISQEIDRMVRESDLRRPKRTLRDRARTR